MEVDSKVPTIDSLQDVSTVFEKLNNKLVFKHEENKFVDFDRDRLMYHMISSEGPPIAVSDVNNDQLEDIYVGGSKGYAGRLFIQNSEGRFTSTNEDLFELDKLSEDTDALFFDADNDGDNDLYVASGGYEFSNNSQHYQIDCI